MAKDPLYVKLDEKIIAEIRADILKHSVALKLVDQWLKKRKVREN